MDYSVVAAVLSQPTFVHLVIAAPIRHKHSRETCHSRRVATAAPECAARVLAGLPLRRWRLPHKPHARTTLHSTATVLPRVVAHHCSFRQFQETIQAQLFQPARKPLVGSSASLLRASPACVGFRNQPSPSCISSRNSCLTSPSSGTLRQLRWLAPLMSGVRPQPFYGQRVHPLRQSNRIGLLRMHRLTALGAGPFFGNLV